MSYLSVTAITYWLEYLREYYSDKLKIQNGVLNNEIAERKKIEEEREKLTVDVQSASKGKSEFLANMSHEIRTPLNGVIGVTTLMLDTQLDDNQRHYVSNLKKSGGFLLTIINDILDVSKIEAGKLELSSTPFNLRELIDGFSEIARQLPRSKEVEIVIGVSSDVCQEVYGDKDRIQQRLLNLTSNALKFTDRGTVSIRVTGCE